MKSELQPAVDFLKYTSRSLLVNCNYYKLLLLPQPKR